MRSPGCDLPEDIAALKGSIFEADDGGWEFDNLQLLAALPSSKTNVLDPVSDFYMSKNGPA